MEYSVYSKLGSFKGEKDDQQLDFEVPNFETYIEVFGIMVLTLTTWAPLHRCCTGSQR